MSNKNSVKFPLRTRTERAETNSGKAPKTENRQQTKNIELGELSA